MADKVPPRAVSAEDAAKAVTLANAFAGDVVKRWLLGLKNIPLTDITSVFPEGWLNQTATVQLAAPDGSAKYDVYLAVVPPTYRLDWANLPFAQELGPQIAYLLTMAQLYVQYALQRYEALQDTAGLLSFLTPTPHGTMYHSAMTDKPALGVMITRIQADAPECRKN